MSETSGGSIRRCCDVDNFPVLVSCSEILELIKSSVQSRVIQYSQGEFKKALRLVILSLLSSFECKMFTSWLQIACLFEKQKDCIQLLTSKSMRKGVEGNEHALEASEESLFILNCGMKIKATFTSNDRV